MSDLFKRIDQVSAKATEFKNKTSSSRSFEAGNRRPGWQRNENDNFANNRAVRNNFNGGEQHQHQQIPRQHQQQREGNSQANFRGPRSNEFAQGVTQDRPDFQRQLTEKGHQLQDSMAEAIDLVVLMTDHSEGLL